MQRFAHRRVLIGLALVLGLAACQTGGELARTGFVMDVPRAEDRYMAIEADPPEWRLGEELQLLAVSPSPSGSPQPSASPTATPTPTPTATPTAKATATVPPFPAGVKVPGISLAALDADIVRLRNQAIFLVNTNRDITIRLFRAATDADRDKFRAAVATGVATYTTDVATVRTEIGRVNVKDYGAVVKATAKARNDMLIFRSAMVSVYNDAVKVFADDMRNSRSLASASPSPAAAARR
jgi:hypothetical protein